MDYNIVACYRGDMVRNFLHHCRKIFPSLRKAVVCIDFGNMKYQTSNMYDEKSGSY